jgi:hypothetical protein
MSLPDLHAKHLAELTGEAQLEYLLNCLDYLEANDVCGWKRRFAAESLSTETSELKHQEQRPKKKRRMSPDALVWQCLPPCRSCGSGDTVEDIREGSVVCTVCGLIQQTQILGVGDANMSYEQLKNGNRKKVHQYSRVVYFRSFLMGLQGKTRPIITPQELESLRATCAGESSLHEVDEVCVVKALKKLKLSIKFRRHRYSIACMLNPHYKVVHIDASVFFLMLKLFRVVECHWQHGMKRKLGERKVFFSYPYVYYQLCVHLDLMHLTGKHHLLFNEQALNKQHYAYGCIAKKASFKFDVEVHRNQNK